MEDLDREDLLSLINCYNNYVIEFYDEHEEGMQPVSVYEFFENEYQQNIETTKNHNKVVNFKIIAEDELKRLFDKFEKNKDFEAEEMENFLIKHDDGVYTAIDNTCGGLYLEDFTTIEEAVKWLNKEDLEKNNENQNDYIAENCEL